MKRRPPPAPKRPRPKTIQKPKTIVPPRAVSVKHLLGTAPGGLIAEERVQKAKSKLEKTRLAAAPGMRSFMEELERRMEEAGSFEEALAQWRARAEAVARRHRSLFELGSEIARRLAGAHNVRQFRTEVLDPLRTRSITGEEAWARADRQAGMNLRERTANHHPALTIGLGVVVEGGVAVGLEIGAGMAGMRHRETVYYVTETVGLGLYAGIGVGVEVEFARCDPMQFGGPTVGFDLGGAWAVGVGGGVAFAPVNLLAPLPEDRWDWDSAAFCVAAAAEVEACGWIEFAQVISRATGEWAPRTTWDDVTSDDP